MPTPTTTPGDEHDGRGGGRRGAHRDVRNQRRRACGLGPAGRAIGGSRQRRRIGGRGARRGRRLGRCRGLPARARGRHRLLLRQPVELRHQPLLQGGRRFDRLGEGRRAAQPTRRRSRPRRAARATRRARASNAARSSASSRVERVRRGELVHRLERGELARGSRLVRRLSARRLAARSCRHPQCGSQSDHPVAQSRLHRTQRNLEPLGDLALREPVVVGERRRTRAAVARGRRAPRGRVRARRAPRRSRRRCRPARRGRGRRCAGRGRGRPARRGCGRRRGGGRA